MAFLSLQLSYEAVLLSKLLKHYSDDYIADWKIIKNDAIFLRSFDEILWSSPKLRPRLLGYSRLLTVPLQALDRNVEHLISPILRCGLS